MFLPAQVYILVCLHFSAFQPSSLPVAFRFDLNIEAASVQVNKSITALYLTSLPYHRCIINHLYQHRILYVFST